MGTGLVDEKTSTQLTGKPGETLLIPGAADTLFDVIYRQGRDELNTLYGKGKTQQWDANVRIDWSLPIDYDQSLTYGALDPGSAWDVAFKALSNKDRAEWRRAHIGLNFSQFLQGEQGALLCAAKLVQVVPALDAKKYAATQAMDEARHVEVFERFLREKVGRVDPINDSLKALIGQAIGDRRWDFTFLGMQLVIESLALASFGYYRDFYRSPLIRQVTGYVIQDEARHVAYGRISLRNFYQQFTEAERREREEFLIEACYLMRDRFFGQDEITKQFGLPVADESSAEFRAFRNGIFVRVVPMARDVGLWSPFVQQAFEKMGVLEFGTLDLARLQEDDQERATEIDEERAAALKTLNLVGTT